MVSATFRFYEVLNGFLPPVRRGRDFAAPCARDATVKHMIEALGVPHTEAGLVLVNGESSGFERRLVDGDRVAVYPGIKQFNVQDVQRLRQWPQGPLRFVADAHLGGLARLLRMAGFDTLYDNNYHDAEVERIACEEERVLLTRDRALLMRRTVELGCYLHATDPEEQLRELFVRLGLASSALPFTRCLHCNLPLRAVTKAEVLERLPPRVAEVQDEFTACDGCRRVFWKGSHYARMRVLLDSVAADVEFPRPATHHSDARD